MAMRLRVGLAAIVCLVGLVAHAAAEERAKLDAVLDSISATELRRNVNVLADDMFEGREAGSRGGRAAGVYLGKEYQRLKLAGAGTAGGYYQQFGPRYANILGLLPGRDPQRAHEVIVIGAHYDHVGYGTLENSYGPIGHIHNGADDNASGVSGVLELARALERLDPAPSRPILLALWDGEEKGLLGSIYWLDHPTVPIGDVKFYINFDMIGRLRNNRIEMYGSRTAAGLRRLASEHNDRANFLLQFTWEMKADSDHYTFFAHNIPTLMPHTGLHADYHRPSDDAEKIDVEGMRRVCQYTAALVADLAERERLPAFRPQSRSETVTAQQVVEKPLPPQPGRLGLGWAKPDGSPGLIVARVTADSIAAQSGIVAGDRIVKFEHQDVATGDELQRMVLTSPADCTLTVVHAQQPPRELHVKLAGTAVRWGFAWREDAAEPGTLIVVRVVDGSAADRAGLVPRDRIYRIDGHNFTGGVDFREALRTAPGAVTLEVENQGRMRNVKVEP